MSRLHTFSIAALTGILGLGCSSFLGFAYVSWYQASRSALSNNLNVLIVAVAGGAASLALGFVVSRLSKFAFVRTLAWAWTAVFAVSGAILAVLMMNAHLPAYSSEPSTPPVNMIGKPLPTPPQVRDSTPNPKILPRP